jgi:hypothetical protein
MLKPDQQVRFWCWAQVVGVAIPAWGLGALVYFMQRGAIEESSALLLPLFLIGLGFAFFSFWKCSRAVAADATLTEAERQRIQSWLRGFGPAGAVQLLLFIYFPGSRFAGH